MKLIRIHINNLSLKLTATCSASHLWGNGKMQTVPDHKERKRKFITKVDKTRRETK